jgi:hypothetical protein
MPARPAPRGIVLRWLAERFEPGRRYPEREVNELLRRSHPDNAMLRRYLVDHGLLERDHGVYWRPGPTPPPPPPGA